MNDMSLLREYSHAVRDNDQDKDITIRTIIPNN